MATNPAFFGLVDEIDEQGTREGTSWSADGHRNYVRTFLVEVVHDVPENNKFLGATQICQAPGIPLPGAPYITTGEVDLAAVAVKTSAKRLMPDSRYWWVVTVEYSTNMPEGGITVEGDGNPDELGSVANNPELRPWHIEWDPKIITQAPQSDLFGFPFWNSATQPFNPAYSQETARACLMIVNNLRTFSRQDVTRYSYVCNADDYFGCPAGTVLCHPPRAVLQWYGTISYFRVRWMLEFGEDAPLEALKSNWILYENSLTEDVPEPPDDNPIRLDGVNLLDAGLMRLQNNPAKAGYNMPVPIYGPLGQITQPDLLDGNGQPVVPDADGYRAPTYLFFRTRRRVPFAGIFTSGLGGLI